MTFRSHQITLEREQRATGERGDVFIRSAAAISIHGITAATATPGALLTPDLLAFHAVPGTATTPAGDFALQALNNHLDRMADVATNSGLTLFQLANASMRLTATTSKQYETIKKLLTDIKLSSSSSKSRSSSTGAGDGTTNDQKNIKFLQTALKIAGPSRVLLLPRMGSRPPPLKKHLQEQNDRARGHSQLDQSCRPQRHQEPRLGQLCLTAWVSSEN